MDEKVPRSNIIETEIPMGTVHPAALEPYRVRFFVEDEIVQEAEITIGVNHRGIERIMEGLPVEKANALTEKICGICSNSHIWNSCRTAEMGLGIEIPERAKYIRVIMGELERLHSHFLYLAHGCEVLSHETFSMRIFYMREIVMELLAMVGGNRVQYGCSVLGGVRPRCDLDEAKLLRIKNDMDALEEGLTGFVERFLADSILLSRVTGIGVLPQKQAIELAVTGPTLRATGVARDLRTTMFEYDDFDFNVITQPDGDVKSNLIMRALESFESIKLIRQAIANIPEGKVINRDWEMFDTDITESYIEVPRGTLYHSYALESGRVRHCIIRTPSMANIGAMQYACIGDQITDAQLCIVQCDPCFTCTDRAIEIVRR
ncbi:hydrogenase large subunit [Methanobrevibacter sp.]